LNKNEKMNKALKDIPTDLKTTKNIVALYNFFE